MLRKTKSVYFRFIYVEVRGKTPSGRHNRLFLLSVSQDISVSSRGPTAAPVFPAHPSFAWLQRNIAEIPLWEASRASVLRRQPEKAWPRAWPTSGTSWKASVDTRNQWKQKEEGRGGPATAGAGEEEGDSAKCTDESLLDLSLARRGGGRRWCARTFLLGSLLPAPTLPAVSIWLPTAGLEEYLLWVPKGKNGGRWIVLLSCLWFT